MARYKTIDMSTQLISIDFARQTLPGCFEYALCYLLDREMDLSGFEQRFCNDEGGAPARLRRRLPVRGQGVRFRLYWLRDCCCIELRLEVHEQSRDGAFDMGRMCLVPDYLRCR